MTVCLTIYILTRASSIINSHPPPPISPLAAEAEAALEVYGRARYIRAFLGDLLRLGNAGQHIPVTLVTDSKSLAEAVKSDNSLRDRRTAICVATLRHCTEYEKMKVQWVSGKENISDILTKEGVSPDLMRAVLSGAARLPAQAGGD